MGLLFRSKVLEERDLSFQTVFGSGGDYHREGYSVKDALGLSAVVACVQLRANTISQLPFKAYRSVAGGAQEEVSVQPSLLVNPSAGVTRSTWVKQMMLSRDLFGNAFGLVTSRDGALRPKTVEWLPPDKVQATERFVGGGVEFRMQDRTIDAVDMVVVPSIVLPGTTLGVAPLFYSGLVDLGKKAQEFGRDWFKNGATPSAIISASNQPSQEQSEQIKSTVMNAVRNRKPLVLSSKYKYEQVSTAANESQFLETMRHSQVDICQVFGVPPEKIGVGTSGQSITYANRDQQQEQWLIDGLNSDLVLIEEVLSGLIAQPYFVKFNTAALLRSDAKTRMEMWAINADIESKTGRPVYTNDEIRLLENRKPLPQPEITMNDGGTP